VRSRVIEYPSANERRVSEIASVDELGPQYYNERSRMQIMSDSQTLPPRGLA